MFGKPKPPQPFQARPTGNESLKTRLEGLRVDMHALTFVLCTSPAVTRDLVVEARMLVGLAMRELNGGATPYTPSERQRANGNDAPIPDASDVGDATEKLKLFVDDLPNDREGELEKVRGWLMLLIQLLKTYRDEAALKNEEARLFLEHAVVKVELARSWLGYHVYPSLRNVQTDTPGPR
jgi:hypothetical protein